MKFGIQSDLLNFNSDQIEENLKKRVTPWELFSLVLLFSLILVFSFHHQKGFYQPWDFKQSYLLAGAGDYTNFFYAYWIMPLFWLLEKIPFPIAYSFWAILNVLGTFFASRVFGGKSWLAIFSYQMIYVVFYGQITGLLLGGMALAWLGIARKKLHLTGLGFLIMAVKPQFGLPMGLIIWLLADLSWKERISILIVPLIGVGLTFIFYPDWIQNILLAIQNEQVDQLGDISLWRYLGPWSLIFYLPPMVLRLNPEKRMMLLITTATFAIPYLQHTELLVLFVFPFGWLSLLSNLGLLFPFFEYEIISRLFIVPLIIYIGIVAQHGIEVKRANS